MSEFRFNRLIGVVGLLAGKDPAHLADLEPVLAEVDRDDHRVAAGD